MADHDARVEGEAALKAIEDYYWKNVADEACAALAAADSLDGGAGADTLSARNQAYLDHYRKLADAWIESFCEAQRKAIRSTPLGARPVPSPASPECSAATGDPIERLVQATVEHVALVHACWKIPFGEGEQHAVKMAVRLIVAAMKIEPAAVEAAFLAAEKDGERPASPDSKRGGA